MMPSWRKLSRLRPDEIRLLFWAIWLLTYAWFRLPITRFRASVPKPASTREVRVANGSTTQAAAIARLVATAANHHFLTLTCLHRSVVLWWILKRLRVECALRLGVRNAPTPFAAHAWVECEGVPVGEPPTASAGYRVFAEGFEPAGIRFPWQGDLRGLPTQG